MMTTTTPLTPRAGWRTAASVTCLVVGVLFGLLSVFATSRASCALWVAIAVVLVFVSGVLVGSGRRRA